MPQPWLLKVMDWNSAFGIGTRGETRITQRCYINRRSGRRTKNAGNMAAGTGRRVLFRYYDDVAENLIRPHDQHCITSPKCEGIAHYIAQSQVPFATRYVIQVAVWVWHRIVNSWRY